MGPLALIVGTTLLGSGFPERAERRGVATSRGTVELLDGGDFAVLQRHGLDGYRAPHAIDHRAHLLALREAGCERVLAIGSSGSLHRELAVGTFLAPHDFVAPELELTLFDDARGHRVPGFDDGWRESVIGAWGERVEAPLRNGGVYRQMRGPRFETATEIRLLAKEADVVGMTIASECVLAGEVELPYAAICSVDNLANGVGEAPLTREEFLAGVAANRAGLLEALAALLPGLL